jgi:hypothetical protein
MAMTKDAFAGRLAAEVPEAEPVLAEQLSDFPELLLHLLMGDLTRLCEDAWSAGEHDMLQRCLRVLDDALLQGDEYVNNAVAVSFVEDSRWWDPANEEYISSWPEGLRAEVEAQRSSQPDQ